MEGKRIYDKSTKDEVTVYAAQASFFIVLSFFPFIMLLLTLIRFTPNISKSDLMAITVAIMSDILDFFMVGVIDDLYIESLATIVSITAITALWLASRRMLSIERNLNQINKISRKRNYIVRRITCVGYIIVFIPVRIGSLILPVPGSSLQRLISRLFPLIGEVISFITSSHSVAAMAILIVVFMALYAYLSNINQKLRNQVPGALPSATGWIIFSYLSSVYFDHFSNFSYMYWSLTAIALLTLQLYIHICILLIRAEIDYHYTKNYRQWEVEIS